MDPQTEFVPPVFHALEHDCAHEAIGQKRIRLLCPVHECGLDPRHATCDCKRAETSKVNPILIPFCPRHGDVCEARFYTYVN